MANITGMTYQDGTTYLSALEQLRDWINTSLITDVNNVFADVAAQYQAGITNAENTVTTAKTEWDARYDAFIADFTDQVRLLNESAVAGMVPAGAVHDALLTLITAEIVAATTANHTYTDTAVTTAQTALEAADTALGARVDGVQAELDNHHTRHGWGGADQTTIDARQVVDLVRDWVRAGLATTATLPFRIVFAGDSHTQGGERNYNVRLANLLTKGGCVNAQSGITVTTDNTPGVHAWSVAWPGNTSGNYLTAGNLANIDTLDPHLLFHMIGTNDFLNQVNPVTYKANIIKALTDVWTVVPDARQVLIVVWPVTNPGTLTYPWSQYVQAMRDVATQYAGDQRFALYDFGTQYNRSGPVATTPYAGLYLDGIHGTPDLHRALTEQLAVWVGLPSPMAEYGSPKVLVGSTIAAGVHLPASPASTVTLEPAPVNRNVIIHAKALVSASADAALYLQIDQTDGTVLNFPHRIPAGTNESKEFSMVLEVSAHQRRIFAVAGEAALSFTAGGDNDFYNQFWIETTYV